MNELTVAVLRVAEGIEDLCIIITIWGVVITLNLAVNRILK